MEENSLVCVWPNNESRVCNSMLPFLHFALGITDIASCPIDKRAICRISVQDSTQPHFYATGSKVKVTKPVQSK